MPSVGTVTESLRTQVRAGRFFDVAIDAGERSYVRTLLREGVPTGATRRVGKGDPDGGPPALAELWRHPHDGAEAWVVRLGGGGPENLLTSELASSFGARHVVAMTEGAPDGRYAMELVPGTVIADLDPPMEEAADLHRFLHDGYRTRFPSMSAEEAALRGRVDAEVMRGLDALMGQSDRHEYNAIADAAAGTAKLIDNSAIGNTQRLKPRLQLSGDLERGGRYFVRLHPLTVDVFRSGSVDARAGAFSAYVAATDMVRLDHATFEHNLQQLVDRGGYEVLVWAGRRSTRPPVPNELWAPQQEALPIVPTREGMKRRLLDAWRPSHNGLPPSVAPGPEPTNARERLARDVSTWWNGNWRGQD